MTCMDTISNELVLPHLCQIFHVSLDVQGHYELTVHGKVTLAKSTFMLKVCMCITSHSLLLLYSGPTYATSKAVSWPELYVWQSLL